MVNLSQNRECVTEALPFTSFDAFEISVLSCI